MIPFAPARLSTMKGCPRSSCSLGAMIRTTRSFGPPGVNGTTKRTGFVGYSWASGYPAEKTKRSRTETIAARLGAIAAMRHGLMDVVRESVVEDYAFIRLFRRWSSLRRKGNGAKRPRARRRGFLQHVRIGARCPRAT